MTDKRKRISDFAASAGEKALDRIIEVIENIESPVLAYTQTGDPILKADLTDLIVPEPAVISQEDFDKRLALLNRKAGSENVVV